MDSLSTKIPELWNILENWEMFQREYLHHVGGDANVDGKTLAKLFYDKFSIPPTLPEAQRAERTRIAVTECEWLLELMRSTLYESSILHDDVTRRMSFSTMKYNFLINACVLLFVAVVGASWKLFKQNVGEMHRFELVMLISAVLILSVVIAYIILVTVQNIDDNNSLTKVWTAVSKDILGIQMIQSIVNMVDEADSESQRVLDDGKVDSSTKFAEAMYIRYKLVASHVSAQFLENLLDKSRNVNNVVSSEYTAFSRMNDVVMMIRRSTTVSSFIRQRMNKESTRTLILGGDSSSTRDQIINNIVDAIIAGAKGSYSSPITPAVSVNSFVKLKNSMRMVATDVCVKCWRYSDEDLSYVASKSMLSKITDHCVTVLNAPSTSSVSTQSDRAVIAEAVAFVLSVIRNSILKPTVGTQDICDAFQLACMWSDMSTPTVDLIVSSLNTAVIDMKMMYSRMLSGANVTVFANNENSVDRRKFFVISVSLLCLWSVAAVFVLQKYVSDISVAGLLAVAIFLFANIAWKFVTKFQLKHDYNKRMTQQNTRTLIRSSFLVANILKNRQVPLDAWKWNDELLMSITSLNEAYSNCNLFSIQIGSRPSYPIFDIGTYIILAIVMAVMIAFATYLMRPDKIISDIYVLNQLLRSPLNILNPSSARKVAAMMAPNQFNIIKLIVKTYWTVFVSSVLLTSLMFLSVSDTANQYNAMLTALYEVERSCA